MNNGQHFSMYYLIFFLMPAVMQRLIGNFAFGYRMHHRRASKWLRMAAACRAEIAAAAAAPTLRAADLASLRSMRAAVPALDSLPSREAGRSLTRRPPHIRAQLTCARYRRTARCRGVL